MSANDVRDTRTLVSECLRAVGATTVFGDVPLPGIAHVPVADPVLARLLADAAGRIGPGAGAALSGRALRVSSLVGAPHDPVAVDSVSDVPAAIAQWEGGAWFGALDLTLDLDLSAPVPDQVEAVVLDLRPDRVVTLSPDLASLGVAVLVGPGVVRAQAIEGLRAMAGRGGFGVVNTWGAKGVFVWDDPHHFGTAGLQARDFELAGLTEAGVVITSGVDPAEAPEHLWAGAQVVDVHPSQLEALTLGWDAAPEVPERPRLYRELSAAIGPLYESRSVPLSPARAAAGLAATRRPGGLVAADPGPAGLWVARAFPTTEPGSVVVPATSADGFAAAAALVAAVAGRPAVGVTAAPLSDTSAAVVDLARSLGLPLVLEVWGDGEADGPDAQLDRTAAALERGGVHVEHYPVDLDDTRVLVEVAGEVVAWTG